MMRWPSPLEDSLVGNVGDRLGKGTEVRWRLGPSHWQGERKCYERFFSVEGWKGYSQLGDVLGLHSDEIEPIGHVDLDLFDWTKPRVGVDDLSHDTLEYSSKLHRFSWRELERLLIETAEAVINNGAGTPIELRDDPKGHHSEVFEVLYSAVW